MRRFLSRAFKGGSRHQPCGTHVDDSLRKFTRSCRKTLGGDEQVKWRVSFTVLRGLEERREWHSTNTNYSWSVTLLEVHLRSVLRDYNNMVLHIMIDNWRIGRERSSAFVLLWSWRSKPETHIISHEFLRSRTRRTPSVSWWKASLCSFSWWSSFTPSRQKT